jgi:hypothetical protein
MTPTATVTTILFVHVGIILVVSAYYALSAALAPRITERGRIRFANRPWLPALIGLFISVPWVVASLVLMQTPAAPLKFVGALLGCLWILGGLIGGASIAQHVGRASVPSGSASWVHSVRGGLFITLTWVLPLVGWLGMLPLTLATGLGCLLMGLFPMRETSRVGASSVASYQRATIGA